MNSADTSIGGGQDFFPETPWSSVLTCHRDAPERKERLNRLCGLYWRPVYRFVRVAGGAGVEDAKDLTQDFFAHVMEDDFVVRHDPDRGRFRSFLKGALRHFLSNDRRDRGRRKRGGGRSIVPIEVTEIESSRFAQESASPDEIFDRQWARDVVRQALPVLRERLKPDAWKVFESYDLRAEGRPTYAALGREIGLSADDVKNRLTSARAQLREIVLERVTEYVTSRGELEIEMRELFPDGP